MLKKRIYFVAHVSKQSIHAPVESFFLVELAAVVIRGSMPALATWKSIHDFRRNDGASVVPAIGWTKVLQKGPSTSREKSCEKSETNVRLEPAPRFLEILLRRRRYLTPPVHDPATPSSEYGPLIGLCTFKDAVACYSPESYKLRSEPQLPPDIYSFKARSNGQWPYC